MKHGRPIIDLKGQTFGDLTVLDECGRKRKSTLFRVICICGTIEERSSAELRHEGKKRCQNCSRHGLCQTPEYKSWAGMKNRCTNPRNHEYNKLWRKGYHSVRRMVRHAWLPQVSRRYGAMPSRSNAKQDRQRWSLLQSELRMGDSKTADAHRRATKLTEEIVAEIRRQDYTIPISVLARTYGVGDQTIRAVLSGEAWN